MTGLQSAIIQNTNNLSSRNSTALRSTDLILVQIEEIKNNLENIVDTADVEFRTFWDRYIVDSLEVMNDVTQLSQSVETVGKKVNEFESNYQTQLSVLQQKMSNELSMQKLQDKWKDIFQQAQQMPTKLAAEEKELTSQKEQIENKLKDSKSKSEASISAVKDQIEQLKLNFANEAEKLKTELDEQMLSIVLLESNNTKLKEQLSALKLQLLEENSAQYSDIAQIQHEFQRLKSNLEQEKQKLQQQINHSHSKKNLLEQGKANLEKEFSKLSNFQSQMSDDTNQIKVN